MLIIINADDLGATSEVNDSIFDLIRAGLVTSSTLMANGPGFEHAVERIPSFPDCSFGIHLNLTVFAPLTDPSALAPILDSNGCLSGSFLQTRFSPPLLTSIHQELRAQVRRALDAGVPVSHFDSHQHIHTIPSLFPILKSLQREFKIYKVRSTINLLSAAQTLSLPRLLKKKLFRMALSHMPRTRITSGLGDFRYFHAALTQGGCPRFDSLELMVHPGATSPGYSAEIELLRSEWKHLLPADATFGSYHSL